MVREKPFPLRQGCLLLPPLFNMVLEDIPGKTRQKKSNKRHPNWKERSEMISVHIILYIDTLTFPQENYEN